MNASRFAPLLRNGALMGNIAARVGALISVFAATLLLAHNGGAAVVGVYALYHVLPGLVGTLSSSGLPVAAPYFLAGAERDDRHLHLTLVALALAGGVVGTVIWAVAAPLIGPLVFPDLSVTLVAASGLLVMTRLAVITAKACSQGTHDLTGSNAIIFVEQVMFLPAYALLTAAGVSAMASVVFGLMLADVATGTLAWGRIANRRFFHGRARPSLPLARRVAVFGLRGQVGGVMSLLNLRLDFVLLSAFAGPAVLGVYAVASKFAELPRILGMALQYVYYPRFARDGMAAAGQARSLALRAGLFTTATIAPLWVLSGIIIPAFYGSGFDGAVTPTRIILLGLALDGVSGVITAFLYGVGRPGMNSLAMATGLVATVVLDLILIPRHEAVGAAIASAVAYTATGVMLLMFFRSVVRWQRPSEPSVEPVEAGGRLGLAGKS